MIRQTAFSRASTLMLRRAGLFLALSAASSAAAELPGSTSSAVAPIRCGDQERVVATTRSTQESPACCGSLAPVEFLLGRWEGTQEGQPGSGTVTREYTRELNGRFIRAQNRSVYPPQAQNPKGEVHEDVGYFSLDRARKLIVFRQFHVEGFVIQYVWDAASTASRVVMTAEAIENIPKGYRARETYIQVGPDEVEEIFELAEPNQDFKAYSRTRLKRVR